MNTNIKKIFRILDGLVSTVIYMCLKWIGVKLILVIVGITMCSLARCTPVGEAVSLESKQPLACLVEWLTSSPARIEAWAALACFHQVNP